jgi:glycosyltransferase involved in cell wall biosynthesis
MAVTQALTGRSPSRKPVCRLLVDSLADDGLTNAQMTNAREIVLRLNPEQFQVSIFHFGVPDERIRKRPNTRLIALPAHRQSLRIFREFVLGAHDILFYLKIAPASRWYMGLRKIWKDRHIVVGTVESRSDLRNEPTIPQPVARMWEQTILRCDYLFSNSQAVRQSLQREFGVESEVVPTGVDTKFFVPAEAKPINARATVLFVGSLRPFKQPQFMLEAARRFPQADFVIVGEGVLATELKDRKESEKLTNLRLMGGLGIEALLEQLHKADIFLFPSRWEGSPKVVLEAAACALPVIARKDYEPETVVDGQTGYLAADDQELFSRLEELLQRRELAQKLGAAGRCHAESYDWDRIAEQWSRIFLRLVNRAAAE